MQARARVQPGNGTTARWTALPLLLATVSLGCDTALTLIEHLPPGAAGFDAAPDDSGPAVTGANDSGSDGSVDDALATDGVDATAFIGDAAAADAPPSGPFGTPTLVPILSTGSTWDEDPTLTGDMRELYFESSRSAGNQDIWVSRRASATAPWGTPQRVAELSTTAAEQGPAVSLDGLTLWFGSNRGSSTVADYDIWTSSRSSRTDAAGSPTPWNAPTRVAEIASTSVDTAPSVDESGLVMVFMSNRPGGKGGYDIYMTTRGATADRWGTPVDLPNVNTANDESDPFLGGHTLQLFWGSSIGSQIWRAARLSTTQPFTNAKAAAELGNPDYCPTLSVDLHHIFFGAARSGARRIYEAFR